MADSSGMARSDGGHLADWHHVEQSIQIILTTPIGSRVMRRDFGSILLDLVDRKLTPSAVLSIYSACALALLMWEPRFRLTSARLVSARQTGQTGVELFGVYFPRGHLGDFTVKADTSTRVMTRGTA